MSATILVAVEATDIGKHILRVAGNVAQQHHNHLQLLNVVEPAVQVYADLNFAPLLETTADWQRQLVAEHVRFFNKTADCLAPEQILVHEGYPAQEIVSKADALNAGLIVMGLHNRRGLQKLLGSTTHAVLNHCERDILAVHPDSAETPYQRVLIAVDTSDLLPAVLQKAAAFTPQATDVQVFSTVIPLYTVFAAPEASHGLNWSFDELAKDIEEQTRSKVTAAVKAAELTTSQIEVHSGDPREEILAAARQMNADLIVIGSHRRNLLNRLMLGSTARAVLDGAPCDVLVCREA